MRATDKRPTDLPVIATTAWFLVGMFGADRTSQHYAVRAFPFRIGRRPDASLCLPIKTVSSHHAEIDQVGTQLVLRDLQSTNGTFLNGRRVETEAAIVEGDLIQLADVALRLQRHDSRLETHAIDEDVCDQALALVQFDKLMSERQVTPNYQPIILMGSREIVAYEVVGRSKLLGVETPQAMFHAAAKLNLEVPLSNMLRWEGVMQSHQLTESPHLFVNTHPRELEHPGLIPALAELRSACPHQSITVEIHENAISGAEELAELKAALHGLNYTLAFDDFGVGQSRLNDLAEAVPDFIKFDISLIRNLDSSPPRRRQIVERLVHIAQDVGAVTVAEGIETEAEAEACLEIGFEMAQGFLFGRPAPLHHAFSF